ncbi:MAG: serine hydrolase domain-containing protein [Armatimonadota bacterium]
MPRLGARSMWLCAALCLALAAADASGQAMVFPGDDWQEAPPASQRVDPQKLDAAMEYLAEAFKDTGGIRETVVIRNGRMIWQGEDIDRRHSIWSASKSYASTVLGLLIDDGKCTLDTPAKDIIPELAERYPTVTLRHFATMTSGYDAEGGGYGKSDPLDGSKTPFDPTTPLFAPGARFGYWDDAMRQFGNILTQIAGEPLEATFKRRIADPISMDPAQWRWRSRGTVKGLLVNDAAGGIDTTARELARFGHLFLNRGNWSGRQLVSAAWVDQATAVHVPATIPHNAISDRQKRIDGRGVYGLNWWVNGIKPDGTRKWPAATARTYAASGFNENKCFVIPEWGMVVVRMGTEGRPDNIDEVWSTFFGKLREALGK